ncbi:uncharacterized protein [Aristolochia californica]|uniref:uncharacterized protein n=1 Tax=Aristolochia californica TaxID=171875 RepID=UPI0035DA3153
MVFVSFVLFPATKEAVSAVTGERFHCIGESFFSYLLRTEREGSSMEYERIDKVQTGIISPSKLRLKLLGAHNLRKEGGNNSSRTSPSKLEDLDYSKSSLLADRVEEFPSEGGSKDLPGTSALASKNIKGNQGCSHPKEIESKVTGDTGHVNITNNSKGVGHQVHFNTNLSSVHPVRSLEEDYSDYDSGHDNASTSSFEFHKGERTLHNSIFGPFSRPIPSKWNDAEKWIPSRHTVQPSLVKKTLMQSQMIRQPMAGWMRVTPEVVLPDQRANHVAVLDAKQPDTLHPAAQSGLEKFTAVGSLPDLVDERGLPDQCPSGVDSVDLLNDQEANQNATTMTPAVKSVSMRDTGTEMTPMTSHEPSRTGTPVGSITPLRSPTSSIPSTPRTGEPRPSPAEFTTETSTEENKNYELSEKELQIKTRKEIVALGLRLGKMNVAAWASKEQNQYSVKASPESRDPEQLEKLEYENRAAAWEEAEKSKHSARYRREEIKIQAWESHQKAKIEAEMKRLEALVQQRKAQAQERMMNKLASLRQRSEEKRAMAEARKNQQAAKSAEQAEYIRQTGRIPSTNIIFCSCFP